MTDEGLDLIRTLLQFKCGGQRLVNTHSASFSVGAPKDGTDDAQTAVPWHVCVREERGLLRKLKFHSSTCLYILLYDFVLVIRRPSNNFHQVLTVVSQQYIDT